MSSLDPRHDELVQLVAPNGLRIAGTAEVVPARADTLGFCRGANGRLRPEYTGYTEILWNHQVTNQTPDEQLAVLDEGGNRRAVGECVVDVGPD